MILFRRTGLPCLCEKYGSGPERVAPTVLRIMIVTVPSPSGLGYVLPRLPELGFCRSSTGAGPLSRSIFACGVWFVTQEWLLLVGRLQCVSRDSAPEARNTLAQPGRAGYLARKDFERRRCGRCLRWLRLRRTNVLTQMLEPRHSEVQSADCFQSVYPNWDISIIRNQSPSNHVYGAYSPGLGGLIKLQLWLANLRDGEKRRHRGCGL
jgi:hypothetical protein